MMPIANTREEVAAQPEVTSRVLGDLAPQIERLAKEMHQREVEQVLASGSGDSWFAAQSVGSAEVLKSANNYCMREPLVSGFILRFRQGFEQKELQSLIRICYR